MHHIAEQFNRALQIFTQHTRIVNRRLVRGESVEFSANLIKLQRNLLPIEGLRSLKHHMLEKVRNARDSGIRLIARPRAHII